MSENRDGQDLVEIEPIEFASAEQLIEMLKADWRATSLKEVDGVMWIIGDQYVSREILGLPQGIEERQQLLAAIRAAFDPEVPVAEVRLAGDEVTESVYVVANRFNKRAPVSLRTY